MSVKPVVAVAAALVLAGCVNTPSPSITPSATGASATPTSSKSSIAAMRFTQPERDLLAATGRSAFDADADQYVGTTHGLCTSMQSLGDAGIARMLNQAEEHRAREIVLISTFLCPSVLDAVKAGAQGRGKFVDGTYYVGTGPGELPPGKYRTEGPAKDCYWVRKDASGAIIANDLVRNAPGGVRISVAATDYEVTMERCGVWIRDSD